MNNWRDIAHAEILSQNAYFPNVRTCRCIKVMNECHERGVFVTREMKEERLEIDCCYCGVCLLR